MNNERGKRFIFVAAAVSGLAIVGSIGACSGDDDNGIFGDDSDASSGTGGDATMVTVLDSGSSMMTTSDSSATDDATTVTDTDASGDDDSTTDAGNGADSSTTDGASPDAGVDSGKPGIWAFTDYCGSASTGSCPILPACATPLGGIEATACTAGTSACLGADVGASTLHRLFSCLPTGHQAWDVNGLCDSPAETCASGGPANCSPDDSTVFGTTCDSVDAGTKCSANNQIWACLPSGSNNWMFDGYCGVGTNAACGSIPVCVATSGMVIAGSPCTTPRAQCVNNGDKVFVCAPR